MELNQGELLFEVKEYQQGSADEDFASEWHQIFV